MNALVLFSGGLDSLACVAFYRKAGFDVGALFVDYGQRASTRESQAAEVVAGELSLPLRRLTVCGLAVPTGFITGRNAILLTVALLEVGDRPCLVALGIHAGTAYSDCTPAFVLRLQAVYDLYTSGAVRVAAPFLNWTKLQVWKYLQSSGYSTDSTYSCELGLDQPCDQCATCADLRRLYAH